MIRFVDIETGNTFDGTYPYIFWMGDGQSTNMFYSKPICFISNKRNINISIEKNEIFNLVDPSKLINSNLESIYGFEYHNIKNIMVNELKLRGEQHHNYFVYIAYVMASAKQPGEYIIDLNIDGENYKVGSNFYSENEELYINLANNGVEIPESIQKAIYDVNVHEESRDNIIMNRKWKELLSNLWDIIANKGSYKSLYNSLKWFEYGDKLKIYELWRNPENNKLIEKEIQEILSENFFQTLSEFSKTTYLSLCYSLESPKTNNGSVVWDNEKNPSLEKISSKWSTQDLALKLSLLGSFYETYFMPIYLDLIHSTIEDVVYTSPFKIIKGSTVNRNDFIYNFEDIKCNVKNGDSYILDTVHCHVKPTTLFGLNYEGFKNLNGSIIGVQSSIDNFKLDKNEHWQTYASQMYSGIGAIVRFDIQIPLSKEDQIKRETLVFKTFNKKTEDWKYESIVDYKILNNSFSFELFCPCEGEYDVKLQFDSVFGKVFTKAVRFNVIDNKTPSMNIYKIYHKFTLSEDELDKPCQLNDYIYSRRKITTDHSNPIQYIPAKKNIDASNTANIFNWRGISLSHMMIIRGNIEQSNTLTPDNMSIIKYFYFLKLKEVQKGSITEYYTVLISKSFNFSPESNENMNLIYKKLNSLIYKEDYIFVPEFHQLVPLDNERNGRLENIKYYEITDNDALCVIPNLPYGLTIDKYDWEFINVSKPNQKPISLNYIKEPFITNDSIESLPPGYYTIRFNYRLTNEDKINTIELNSAFKKV